MSQFQDLGVLPLYQKNTRSLLSGGVVLTILADVEFDQFGEVGDAWGDTIQVILAHR